MKQKMSFMLLLLSISCPVFADSGSGNEIGFFGDIAKQIYQASAAPEVYVPQYCLYSGGGDVPCYNASKEKYIAGIPDNGPSVISDPTSPLTGEQIRGVLKFRCTFNLVDAYSCVYYDPKSPSGDAALAYQIEDQKGYLAMVVRALAHGADTWTNQGPFYTVTISCKDGKTCSLTSVPNL